jgi:hypothetical protein
MSTIAKAPPGLRAAGRCLWRTISAEYELREDERQALAAACRTADEIKRLEDALTDAPATVEGSTGQTRVHPLFAEVRAHRLALAKLLQAVGLPSEELPGQDITGTARSSAARQLARRRWGQAGGV